MRIQNLGVRNMVGTHRRVRKMVVILVSCLTIMAETESKKVALPQYPVVIDERVWYAKGLLSDCEIGVVLSIYNV